MSSHTQRISDVAADRGTAGARSSTGRLRSAADEKAATAMTITDMICLRPSVDLARDNAAKKNLGEAIQRRGGVERECEGADLLPCGAVVGFSLVALSV